jgi:hypothetical protein
MRYSRTSRRDCLKNSRRGFLNGRCLVAEDDEMGFFTRCCPLVGPRTGGYPDLSNSLSTTLVNRLSESRPYANRTRKRSLICAMRRPSWCATVDWDRDSKKKKARYDGRSEGGAGLHLPPLFALLAHQTPPRAPGLPLRGHRHHRQRSTMLVARALHGTQDDAIRLHRPPPGRWLQRDQDPRELRRSGASGARRGVGNRGELRRTLYGRSSQNSSSTHSAE